MHVQIKFTTSCQLESRGRSVAVMYSRVEYGNPATRNWRVTVQAPVGTGAKNLAATPYTLHISPFTLAYPSTVIAIVPLTMDVVTDGEPVSHLKDIFIAGRQSRRIRILIRLSCRLTEALPSSSASSQQTNNSEWPIRAWWHWEHGTVLYCMRVVACHASRRARSISKSGIKPRPKSVSQVT